MVAIHHFQRRTMASSTGITGNYQAVYRDSILDLGEDARRGMLIGKNLGAAGRLGANSLN